MKKGLLLLAALVYLMASSQTALAHKARYHSIFIYNFCKYIHWPEGDSSRFVIGVFGSSEVTACLEQMVVSNKGKGLSIEVRQIDAIASVKECNVLYVATEESGRMPEIIEATTDMPILLITDYPGLAYKGSVINFTVQEGGVRFELNKKNAADRGLKVAECLQKLAIVV
jgi:hypothetical protein